MAEQKPVFKDMSLIHSEASHASPICTVHGEDKKSAEVKTPAALAYKEQLQCQGGMTLMKVEIRWSKKNAFYTTSVAGVLTSLASHT